jgi:hexokinase
VDLSPLALNVDQLQDVRRSLYQAVADGLARPDQPVLALPAYLPPPDPGITGEALVVDLGGTNLRAALVRVNGPRSIEVLAGPSKRTLRDADGRVPASADAFFELQAQLVAELGIRWDHHPVGYVFSYPAEILPDADAVLLRWTKGIDIPGVVGERVGAGLSRALHAGGLHCGRVVVLNDTVAALVGGAYHHQGDPRRVIGLIAGTGTNMAAFFEAAQCLKIPTSEGSMAINLESGNFNPPHRCRWDEAVDGSSNNPGQQRFEKTLSGVYLPQLYARILGLDAVPSSAAELDRQVIESGPHADVAQALLQRSADLVAGGLAGVIDHLGPGPVGILAEGSLFWHSPGYAARVKDRLQELCPTSEADVLRLDDVNLYGAAVAALTMKQS